MTDRDNGQITVQANNPGPVRPQGLEFEESARLKKNCW